MGAESFEFVSDSPERTAAIGAAIATVLSGGECLAIDGELGAGKTVLVRAMAESLGVDPSHVSSPTFVILQRYRGSRIDLVHADAYRLRTAHELESTGWNEAIGDARVVVAIEWASKAETALPSDAIRIVMTHDPEATARRRVCIRDADLVRGARWRSAIDSVLAPASCPICGGAVPPNEGHGRFCSARCKSVDLGRWFRGSYRVSRTPGPDDFEER